METVLVHYEEILDAIHEGAYILDKNRIIQYWNKGAEKITGFKSTDMVGKSCRLNSLCHIAQSDDGSCKDYCPVCKASEKDCVQDAEISINHKEGHKITVSIRVIPLKDLNGENIGTLEFFKHASEEAVEREKLKELVKLSFFDDTTGFVNKTYGESKLNAMLAAMDGAYTHAGALLFEFINYDEFLKIYGIKVVEDLLRLTANTLSSKVKDPQLVLCRWSESQLMLIHPNAKKAIFILMANNLRMLMEHTTLSAEGINIQPTISVGGAIAKTGEKLNAFLTRVESMGSNSKKDPLRAVKIDDKM